MTIQRMLGRIGLATGAALLTRRLLQERRRIDFRGRVAIVTGGARGLGFALARELLAEGARVTLVSRTAADLELARDHLASLTGGEVRATVADVGEPGAIARVIAGEVDHHGRLDILVNNAGIIQVGPLDHMTTDDYRRALSTHLFGPLWAMEAAIPVMRAQGGGRIVNISSIGGRVAIPHMAPYTASKFALTGLSNAIGDEVARYGVRVTTVWPGLLRTGSHVNIEVKGRHASEYAWFATAAGLPLVTLETERAAHEILRACRSGKRRLTLGLVTRLAVLADAAVPELTADLLALSSRLLPDPLPLPDPAARSGWESRSPLAPSVLTRRADREVADHNELRGHDPAELEPT